MSAKAWQIDGAFVPHRLAMLQSPAWKAAPRPMKALLEELEIEYLRHKGCANGAIARSYTQLIQAGMKRNTVSEMIRVAEALGFIQVNRNSGIGPEDLRDASLYRLTYLPTGVAHNVAPTDEWKRIKTIEDAMRLIDRARVPRRRIIDQEARGAA